MADVVRSSDLKALDTELYQANEAELKARTLFNVLTNIPAGAKTYAYNVMSRAGAAKIFANGANDVPYVGVFMREYTQKIYSIVSGYEISVFDIRESEMTNQPLDTARAAVARRAVSEEENRIVFEGDLDYNIKGLTNATGIQVTAVPAGAGGGTRWSSKTGMEILADIRNVRAKVTVLKGHDITANLVLAMPAAQYEELQKPYHATSEKTVLEVLQSKNWFGRIVVIPELAGKGTAGSDCLVVFDRSRTVVELGLPMDLTRHEPEYQFPYYKYPVEERTTGLIIRFPMAISRGDGI